MRREQTSSIAVENQKSWKKKVAAVIFGVHFAFSLSERNDLLNWTIMIDARRKST